MADISLQRDGSDFPEPDRKSSLPGRIDVIVLTDVDPPYNVRLVRRDRRELFLFQRLNAVIRADGPAYGIAEIVTIDGHHAIHYEDFGAALVFRAMTGEEFERRHGCRSSTPA